MTHLINVVIDDAGMLPSTAAIEQERRVAIFDLLENNSFGLASPSSEQSIAGPFNLVLAIRNRRLVFDVATTKDQKVAEFQLSLGPFRQVVKDYFQICESYFDAVKKLSPSQIETIDMARRGIHDEGARVLQERLDGKIILDRDTARRLFTLICVLHWGA